MPLSIALSVVALCLGIVTLGQSRLQSLHSWAIVALSLANLVGLL